MPTPAGRADRELPWRFGWVLALVLAPAPAFAQNQVGQNQLGQNQAVQNQGASAKPGASARGATDPDLTALIPDGAVADPARWALDTDAARNPPDPHALPDVTLLQSGAALTGAGDAALRAITIPWPEMAPLPALTSLTPDPDIDAVAGVAREAGQALDVSMPRGGWRGPLGPDAVVRHVGSGVDLVIPRDAAFPELDDVVDRFSGLSALETLGRGDDNLAQLSRRAHDDAALLVEVMRLYGYYDADVSQSVTGLGADAASGGEKPAAGAVTVRFEVVPGARYALGALDLGDMAQSPDHAALLAAFALKSGDPVNTETINAARDRLIDALGHLGHAFAKVGAPALTVDHDTHLADLALPVATGGIYRFGAITSSLPRFFDAHHLQRMARFRPGKPFDHRLLDDLRQAVLSTGIIGGVTITPRETLPPAAGQTGVADIDVKLIKGPQHTLSAQIGQSSGEGFKLEGSWEDRNFFPPEGMLRLRGVLGTREQLAGITFRRSNFMARDQAFNADLYAQTQDTDAYNARTVSAIISLDKQSTLLFQKKWAYSLGIEVIATSELAAGTAANAARTTYFIGALPMKLAYDASNNLLDPTRGFRVAVSLQPAISIQGGPRSSYWLTEVDASVYQPVGHGVVLAARTRIAGINGTGIANIAPSQRLYAGGGASIRGYGYQAVGPQDAGGNPIGGLSLAEFSAEARMTTGMFGGALSVVPFLDAGQVGTTPTPTLRGAKFGAGVGVRYKTTFGPIRFDIGTPLNRSPGQSRIGVYIALGQAF